MLYILNARVSEIREIVTKCCGDNNERGGFLKEMKGFVEECEEELKVVKDEHLRIMELVKKTNEYYLGGGGGSNPFELFLIVRDFVDMVNEVCSDLRRKIEKKNVGGGEGASTTPPLSPSKKAPLRFPKFDLHFYQTCQVQHHVLAYQMMISEAGFYAFVSICLTQNL
ncbi:Formin-like protein [Arachis hypogaea]|nr:Formin-like protein [Arachis hypogaea]